MITAKELSDLSGVGYTTIWKRAKAGKIPCQTDEKGKLLFDKDTALAALKNTEVTPRAKPTKNGKKNDVGLEGYIDSALAAAKSGFRDLIKAAIADATGTDVELDLLRLYVNSDAVFEAVREELTS